MTLYNKTTTEKTYGNRGFTVTIPASQANGTRGPAVAVEGKSKIALQFDRDQVNADREAGYIEFTAE